jgi:hypothetical protein
MKRLSLLLLLFLLAMTATSGAQVSRLPSVAVLEIRVLPESETSKMESQAATDALTQRMPKRHRYDVTPPAEVEKAIKEINLRLPLNRSEMQRLGIKLGVDRVVSGEITKIEVSKNPRRAYVVLSLSFIDAVTGELANGTVAAGYSPPKATGSDEELILKAINNAVVNSLKNMSGGGIIPTATILDVKKGKEVKINRGERDWIHVGDKMIVVRGNKRVGSIKVSSVGPTDSQATIMDGGKEIWPEDQAIGLLDMEDAQ